MKETIAIGLKSEIIIKAEPKHSAKAYSSGLVDVFSTPAMVALMEQTCNELVIPYLNNNETSVGIEICVRHLKATPIGDTVTCCAEIVEIRKNRITFNVEAIDSKGKIGEGTHKRAVIDKELFMENLKN
jgi:predicted thioesterase